MSFIWPWLLLTLLLLPLCALPYVQAQRRRRLMAANLGTLGLVQDARGTPLGWRRHLPFALFLSGLALLFVALARPQMALSLPRIEGTVILAIDVSASMAADDAEPTRMDAAKALAEIFIREQPRRVQIGVVSFSDGGLVVQEPTHDQAALLETIGRLTPQSGTSVGQGMLAALNTILGGNSAPQSDEGDATPAPTPLPSGSFTDAAIVLLSDGENMDAPDPLDVAETAADYGVRVYTVGLGSTTGTTLNLDGFTVFTRLEEEALRQISDVTDGVYYSAEGDTAWESIYNALNAQLVVRAEETEVTALFAGLSIVIFLIGAALSLLMFGRLP